MPSPRYDVARAFIQGKSASNSTKSFRSEVEASPAVAGGVITRIYTYNVCLAERFSDGTLFFPSNGTHRMRGFLTAEEAFTRNLDRRYSVTSTIHQNALRVVLEHPNFGDWKR